ncbi:MAG: diphthamide synthesis protein [Nanobdellota archaeon]
MMYNDYDLEIEKAVEKIKKEGAKKVLIQLPDGLKPAAKMIVDKIKEDTSAEPFIYFGTCYGACDFPVEMEKAGFDLVIAWGHSEWRF